MSGWRQLVWCGAQLTCVVAFLGLVIVVFEAVPGGTPRRSSLIGHWASPSRDQPVDEPGIELDLQMDGRFELRLLLSEPASRPVHLRGRYEIALDHLVMEMPGGRMLWSIARAGEELRHRTKRGRAIRLRRS